MHGTTSGEEGEQPSPASLSPSSLPQLEDANATSEEDYAYYTDGSEQPSEDPMYYSVSYTYPDTENFTYFNLTDQYFLNDSFCCGNDSFNGTFNGTDFISPPSPYFDWEIALISITTVPIIFSIVFGNTLVCIAIATDRNLKSVQNWFIASLAISDLLLGLLVMPLSLANELMGYWIFGNILCDLWLAADVLLCTASILNLCMISLDRYWSITQAINYVRKRTPKRAAFMVAIVWASSAMVCLPPLIGWKTARDTSRYPLCFISEEIGYVVYSCMGSFYIPLIVMVVVYFRIYLAAKARAHRNIKKKTKPPDTEKNNKEKSTTSFSTSSPPKTDQKMSPNLSVIHQEKETTSSEKHENFSDSEYSNADYPQDKLQKNIKFDNVVKSSDEKCKLLSEETDSSVKVGAQEVIANKNLFKGGKAYNSDDTDSTSDFPVPNLRQNGFRKVTKDNNAAYSAEENKRLLQDSDSQADSMKSSSKLAQCRLHNDSGATLPESETTCTTDEDMKNHIAGESESIKETTKLKNLSTILNPNKLQKDSNRESQRQLSYKRQRSDAEKQKRRIARAKERRATIVLGIIMAAFIICWFPFFTLYVIATIFSLHLQEEVFKFFFWLGYCNSALNPVIYTIFNRDFKMAFHKILCKPFNRR
ncbi:alpha-2C adrenergic receptor-like [Lineus longissimus]|uniref:alpha-2C adrenergic receptor-like n=1 Tax=Lineus longissimus TaxID=88925 RepID=UPI00315DBE5E